MNYQALAKYLARWIFALGENNPSGLPITRMQYLHGKYPKEERPGAGLSEGPMADQLATALLTYQERRPGDWMLIATAKTEGSIIGWMPGWKSGSEVHWCGGEGIGGWYLANNDPTDSWGPGALPLTHWIPLPAAPVVQS